MKSNREKLPISYRLVDGGSEGGKNDQVSTPDQSFHDLFGKLGLGRQQQLHEEEEEEVVTQLAQDQRTLR